VAEKTGRLLDVYGRRWDGKPLKDDEFVISAVEKTSIFFKELHHDVRQSGFSFPSKEQRGSPPGCLP
jgi:hypothetical protein